MTVESVKEANALVNKIEQLEKSISCVEEMMTTQNILKSIMITNKQSQPVSITSANNSAIWDVVLATLQADLAVMKNDLQNFGISS